MFHVCAQHGIRCRWALKPHDLFISLLIHLKQVGSMLQHSKRPFVSACFLNAVLSSAIYIVLTWAYRRDLNKTILGPRTLFRESEDRTLLNCSFTLFNELINSRLRTILDENVNVDFFERSGCFVIDTQKTGLYRIVHENNFGRVACNKTQKKFLSPTVDEKRVSTIDCCYHRSFFINCSQEYIQSN